MRRIVNAHVNALAEKKNAEDVEVYPKNGAWASYDLTKRMCELRAMMSPGSLVDW
jgi:hypothetical protein